MWKKCCSWAFVLRSDKILLSEVKLLELSTQEVNKTPTFVHVGDDAFMMKCFQYLLVSCWSEPPVSLTWASTHSNVLTHFTAICIFMNNAQWQIHYSCWSYKVNMTAAAADIPLTISVRAIISHWFGFLILCWLLWDNSMHHSLWV